MTNPIREDGIVSSLADALQYIAVYHPPSFVRALADAYGDPRVRGAR